MGGAEICSMLDFNGTRAAFLLQILEISRLQPLPCVGRTGCFTFINAGNLKAYDQKCDKIKIQMFLLIHRGLRVHSCLYNY